MPTLKRLQSRKILLDTHVWLWLLEGSPKLNSSFIKSVDLIQQHSTILISAMTIWEIGMLVEKGRIELERDRLDWIEEALAVSGVELAPLSPRIMIQSTRLPGEVHGDPVDRILIATARETSAVLVTADRKILEYGKGRFIHVYDPS